MEAWKKDAIAHAAEFPDIEICGFVVGGEYVRGVNTHPNPSENFRTTPPDEGEFDAVVHSHPNGNRYPSKSDMQSQLAVQKPYYIVTIDKVYGPEIFGFGDQLEKPPLLGRKFRHGVTDCYSLVRDYYAEHDVKLDEFPRDWDWWSGVDAEDMYLENFEKCGFYEIPIRDIRKGDGFIAGVRSEKGNHAGIYLGDGLILHHTTSGGNGYDPTRLSNRTTAVRYSKFIRKVVRHDDYKA